MDDIEKEIEARIIKITTGQHITIEELKAEERRRIRLLKMT